MPRAPPLLPSKHHNAAPSLPALGQGDSGQGGKLPRIWRLGEVLDEVLTSEHPSRCQHQPTQQQGPGQPYLPSQAFSTGDTRDGTWTLLCATRACAPLGCGVLSPSPSAPLQPPMRGPTGLSAGTLLLLPAVGSSLSLRAAPAPSPHLGLGSPASETRPFAGHEQLLHHRLHKAARRSQRGRPRARALLGASAQGPAPRRRSTGRASARPGPARLSGPRWGGEGLRAAKGGSARRAAVPGREACRAPRGGRDLWPWAGCGACQAGVPRSRLLRAVAGAGPGGAA